MSDENTHETGPLSAASEAAPAAKPEPTIDPRALTTPNAVENPILSGREDGKWAKSDEAQFRERSFHTYYGGPYSSVKDPGLRFAYALIASCRPFRDATLIPKPTKRKRVKPRGGVITQQSASAENLVARAEATAEGPMPIPDGENKREQFPAIPEL